MKELRARPRAGKERLTRISKGAIRKWQGTMDGGRIPISQPKKKKRRKRLQQHKGLESGGCSVASFFSVAPPPSLGSSSHSPCADVTSGARAAASVAMVARNAQLASARLASARIASAAVAGTAALNAWGARVAATKCFLRATCEEHLPRD